MSFVTLATGTEIDLANVDPKSITLLDIAVGLSHIRRFNGATRVGYSVAAHALHVADLVARMGGTPAQQLAALHHDSHEALVGDMAAPVKWLLDSQTLGGWTFLERRVQRAVLHGMGCAIAFASCQALIHRADMVALATERRDLMPATSTPWPCLDGVLPDANVNVQERARLSDEEWCRHFMTRDARLRADIDMWLASVPAHEEA